MPSDKPWSPVRSTEGEGRDWAVEDAEGFYVASRLLESEARLIAAAPELVEAVKLYRDELAKLLLSGWEMKAIDVTQEFDQIVGPILARVKGGGDDA